MNRILIILGLYVFCLMPFNSHANTSCSVNGTSGHCGSAEVIIYHVNGAGLVFVGVEGDIPGTCKWFKRQFFFDSSTPGGKSRLSVLMSLTAQNKPVKIWYTAVDPSLEGKDETNGCTSTNIATLDGIGWGK